MKQSIGFRLVYVQISRRWRRWH